MTGIIAAYRDRLPVTITIQPVTLGEGGTPLIHAPRLSEQTGCTVHLKVEGLNPTGSFKDRGMTVAVTVAVARGCSAVLCASTGNTSASAAAYAARAGIACAVLIPAGKIAAGKLAQAVMHGAKVIQIDGNFDGCLELARKIAAAVTDEEILAAYHLVARSEGVFVEPASAVGIAGLLKASEDGWVERGLTVVRTVTGNGLKDPAAAMIRMGDVAPVAAEAEVVVGPLELDRRVIVRRRH